MKVLCTGGPIPSSSDHNIPALIRALELENELQPTIISDTSDWTGAWERFVYDEVMKLSEPVLVTMHSRFVKNFMASLNSSNPDWRPKHHVIVLGISDWSSGAPFGLGLALMLSREILKLDKVNCRISVIGTEIDVLEDPILDSQADEPDMNGAQDPKHDVHEGSMQKFVIGPDGSIDVGWIQPEFSDAILEIVPEEKRINEELNGGKEPRIFCG